MITVASRFMVRKLGRISEGKAAFTSSTPQNLASIEANDASYFESAGKRNADAEHKGRFPVEVGQVSSMERVFSAADVADCVRLCGDTNPIHTDAIAATAAGFQLQPVPGILCSALLPAIIGSQHPGSIYLSQTLHFRNPVFVGEMVEARVKVVALKMIRHRLKVSFETEVVKKKEDLVVVQGLAEALVPVGCQDN